MVRLGKILLVKTETRSTTDSDLSLFHPSRRLNDIINQHGLADAKFYQIGNVIVGAGGEAGAGVRGRWTLEAELHRRWLSQIK